MRAQKVEAQGVVDGRHHYGYGFNIAFVFFGLHVLGLGYLILKSDYIPRVLGILLIIASLGYLIDSLASVLSSDYADNEALFLVFIAIAAVMAEYSLAFWLLTRGRRLERVEAGPGKPQYAMTLANQ
jgi:hypothetical protein